MFYHENESIFNFKFDRESYIAQQNILYALYAPLFSHRQNSVFLA